MELSDELLRKLIGNGCPRCGLPNWLNVRCVDEAAYQLSFYLDIRIHPPQWVEEKIHKYTLSSKVWFYECAWCDLVVYDNIIKKWATDEEVEKEVKVPYVW